LEGQISSQNLPASMFLLYLQYTKKQMKGTEAFPSSFIMIEDTQIQAVEKLLLPLLTEDIFLVSIRIKPINNFKIYLDADNGLSIEKCIKINRALYRQMEELGMYPNGDFSLEVSSPGIEEPLKSYRQYVKNIGRNVAISTQEATFEGKLTAVTENGVQIAFAEGKGKKAVNKEMEIGFADIKETIVQIKF